jgi:proteic killer suppression protein
VIRSFADKRTAALFAGVAIRGVDLRMQRRARIKLLMLDAARTLSDLQSPPGNRLEALKGDRTGQYSIRINIQWRLCFVWRDGDAWDVEIVDYHSRSSTIIEEVTMGITRQQLDRGEIDFSDVASDQRIGPISPGKILRDEFLEPLGLSVYALAKALGVSRSRINDIVLGRRGVTAETALRLARYFDTTPDFWLRLQTAHDLETAKATLGARVAAEVKPRVA